MSGVQFHTAAVRQPPVDVLATSRRILFEMNYEVDSEWARFCKFGPDDVGGCWEKLGIIRKRPPRPTHCIVPQAMFDQLQSRPEFDNNNRPSSMLFGLRVTASPLLTNKFILCNFSDT